MMTFFGEAAARFITRGYGKMYSRWPIQCSTGKTDLNASTCYGTQMGPEVKTKNVAEGTRREREREKRQTERHKSINKEKIWRSERHYFWGRKRASYC
jgi:hypothetical protein